MTGVDQRCPVQAEWNHSVQTKPPGTIARAEAEEAYAIYAARYGRSQSLERLCARGGFGYLELAELLGHAPKTWEPR